MLRPAPTKLQTVLRRSANDPGSLTAWTVHGLLDTFYEFLPVVVLELAASGESFASPSV